MLGTLLASILRVYTVWYAVFPARGAPTLLPQHQSPRAGDDAMALAWLVARKLVRAWQ